MKKHIQTVDYNNYDTALCTRRKCRSNSDVKAIFLLRGRQKNTYKITNVTMADFVLPWSNEKSQIANEFLVPVTVIKAQHEKLFDTPLAQYI